LGYSVNGHAACGGICLEVVPSMVKTDNPWNEQELVGRWFRALDQRIIRTGRHEWRLVVTGICVQVDEIWIQLADASRDGASILLRVSAETPVDHAIGLLARSHSGDASVSPAVVTATSSALSRERAKMA
jgi:hypothetical protein